MMIIARNLPKSPNKRGKEETNEIKCAFHFQTAPVDSVLRHSEHIENINTNAPPPDSPQGKHTLNRD